MGCGPHMAYTCLLLAVGSPLRITQQPARLGFDTAPKTLCRLA